MGASPAYADTCFRHCEFSGTENGSFSIIYPVSKAVPGTEGPTKVYLLNLTKVRYLKCFLSSPWKKEIETIQGNTLGFFCPSFVGVGLIFLAD